MKVTFEKTFEFDLLIHELEKIKEKENTTFDINVYPYGITIKLKKLDTTGYLHSNRIGIYSAKTVNVNYSPELKEFILKVIDKIQNQGEQNEIH